MGRGFYICGEEQLQSLCRYLSVGLQTVFLLECLVSLFALTSEKSRKAVVRIIISECCKTFLNLIAGIKEREAAPVLPLLRTFSSQIYWFEQAGAGQTAKLCNQISLAASLAGAAEMLAVAEQSGISPELVAKMVGEGLGGSAQLSRVASRALEGDYGPGFLAEHLRKDLMLALETAENLELTLPETETSFNLVDMLCQAGGSRKGTQAITLLYTDEATSTAAGLDWSLVKAEPQDDNPARQRYYTGTQNL